MAARAAVRFASSSSPSPAATRPLRYAGRTVVVTGGSRGIGEGVTRVFAREGANVVFCGLPSHAQLGRALVAELAPASAGKLLYVEAAGDITQASSVDALVDAAVGGTGRLDCVVNNAASHPHLQAIDEFSVDDLRRLLELNLVAPFALCRAAMPHLRKVRGGGRGGGMAGHAQRSLIASYRGASR